MDHKETQAGSFGLRRADLTAGNLKSQVKGFNFALQIKFLDDNEGVLGDYMVLSTDVFDEMVKHIASNRDTER